MFATLDNKNKFDSIFINMNIVSVAICFFGTSVCSFLGWFCWQDNVTPVPKVLISIQLANVMHSFGSNRDIHFKDLFDFWSIKLSTRADLRSNELFFGFHFYWHPFAIGYRNVCSCSSMGGCRPLGKLGWLPWLPQWALRSLACGNCCWDGYEIQNLFICFAAFLEELTRWTSKHKTMCPR